MTRPLAGKLLYTAALFSSVLFYPVSASAQAQNAGAEAPAVAAQITTPASPGVKDAKRLAMDQLIARNREQNLRDFLQSRGVKEESTVTLLIGYVSRSEATRLEVTQLGRKLVAALGTPTGTPAAEKQVEKLVSEYETALKAFQLQNAKDTADLEKQLALSRNPRLRGVLTVLGVVNDAPPLLPSWRIPGTAPAVSSATGNAGTPN